MIVINVTMSFADEAMAIDWLKKEYIPLLNACPVVKNANLYSVAVQQGADNTFALQIRFGSREDFEQFQFRYQDDFDAALFAKFTNQFGMFKTVLSLM